MGLFDSWGSLASGIVNGAEDVGTWFGSHMGEVVGIASGINGILNPTPVQDGKAGTNSVTNSQTTAAPSWLDKVLGALAPSTAPKAAETDGSSVGTLMLFTTALVVVVLIAKRA